MRITSKVFFISATTDRIRTKVEEELQAGLLWPEPLIQLNPSFEPGAWIDDLVADGILHDACRHIFRKEKSASVAGEQGKRLRLHKHQTDAVKIARDGHSYILTTGTGSGKSLAYIIPIVDHVLRHGSGCGIQAIVIYPMNALANSQEGGLEKFLRHGFPDGKGPVTFARYTGQETDEQKQHIIANPPDILLTNYVMLELLLTRPQEKPLINAAKHLHFLVLDDLHTYRGRQGADVAMLVRRTREAFGATHLQCVGTSATLAGAGDYETQRAEVARIASTIFGAVIQLEHVIGETLRRATPDADVQDPQFLARLRQRLETTQAIPPTDYQRFIHDPLSGWIESTFGITSEAHTGRLIRSKPRSISGREGAAQHLSTLTGLPLSRCAEAIEHQLLASYLCEPNPETGFPVFAFRRHQFISRGDTVYASLEAETQRYISMHGQQYVPGDRHRLLLPLVFCRECGQEYYCVRCDTDPETRQHHYIPRELSDHQTDEESEAGFLYASTTQAWPLDPEAMLQRPTWRTVVIVYFSNLPLRSSLRLPLLCRRPSSMRSRLCISLKKPNWQPSPCPAATIGACCSSMKRQRVAPVSYAASSMTVTPWHKLPGKPWSCVISIPTPGKTSGAPPMPLKIVRLPAMTV
jgi:ATP-dependent helicase YprA (DUF1998 family)